MSEKFDTVAPLVNNEENDTNSTRKDAEAQLQTVEIVDGGLQAWATLVGAFIAVFVSSGYVNSSGVYEDLYVREYLDTHSVSQINWIAGAQTFLLFSTGIFSGYAMDVGYFRILMITGSVLFVFSLFMVSISQPQQWYQLFLAQGLGLGIAGGLLYIPALGIIGHHFKRRRSLAMGIVASGSSLGGVIHPIMLNKLFNGSLGFHWGVRISAFFNLGLLVLANLMMTTRLAPQRKSLYGQIAHWRGFFRDGIYIMATVATFCIITGAFFPTLFLQLDSIEHGVDKRLAFYTIAILNGSSAFGRVLPTIIVDRVGVFNLIVPCTLVCGILILAMIAVTTAAGAISVAVVYGLFSGACISLLGPMLADLSIDMSEVGSRIGVCMGIGGIGALIGPPITGALLTSEYLWLRPALFNGICMCIAAGGLAAAGRLSTRRRQG